MSMLASDLAAIFADTSLTVPVRFAASSTAPIQTTRGFLSTEDVPESDSYGNVAIVARRVLTIQDDALTDLAHGLSITLTVDDVDTVYTVHDHRASGRGKRKVILARAGER